MVSTTSSDENPASENPHYENSAFGASFESFSSLRDDKQAKVLKLALRKIGLRMINLGTMGWMDIHRIAKLHKVTDVELLALRQAWTDFHPPEGRSVRV